MPVLPATLPPQINSRPFLAKEALSLGIPKGRLLRQDLQRILPGVYLPKPATYNLKTIAAAHCLRYPNAVLSRVTAAKLYNFPLPWWLEREFSNQLATTELKLDLCIPKAQQLRAERPPNFYRTLLKPADIVSFTDSTFGIACKITSPELTWIQLAKLVPFCQLVAIGDFLIRQEKLQHETRIGARSSISKLQAAVQRNKGIVGISIARQALRYLQVGSESVPESRLRLATIAAKLPEPKLNQVLIDNSGKVVMRTDLLWEQRKLIVEYDGSHHFDPEAKIKDRTRDLLAQKLGYKTVRIYSKDLPQIHPYVLGKTEVFAQLRASNAVAEIARTLEA